MLYLSCVEELLYVETTAKLLQQGNAQLHFISFAALLNFAFP